MDDMQSPSEVPTEAERIAQLEQEAKEWKDKSLRLLAEMENVRKRMQREKQESIRFAIDNLFVELLSPIDNLENALQFTQHMSEEVRHWAHGFQMILSQFKEILENHGVHSFVSLGMPFDPHLHQAVEIEESETASEGTILHEFVKGYTSGDRTLRPARVKVAKPPLQKPNEEI